MENLFNFIDSRLSRRAQYSLSQIYLRPDQSLPQIFPNYADLEGFYRLIKNPRVSMKDIMNNISDQSLIHCSSVEEFAVIHDTTFINPKSNLRSNFIGKRGLMTHLSLAVSASSNPQVYGPLEMDFIHRTKSGKKGTSKAESLRWTEGVKRCEEKISKSNAIHIMDREGDFFENIFELATNKIRFVVRGCHNQPVKNSLEGKLFDILRSRSSVVSLEAKISKREENSFKSKKISKIHPKRDARLSTLSVSSESCTFYNPRAKKEERKECNVNVIRVWEESPPEQVVPIEWFLITSEKTDSEEEIKKVVNLYRRRWFIEEYFKGLKTGCKLEEKQFEDVQSWKKLIAFYLSITTSILNLRILDKVCIKSLKIKPSDEQIAILKAATKIEIDNSESLLYAIAKLGGHIKYNGPPGWQVLHRGMKQLHSLEQGWRLRCD